MLGALLHAGALGSALLRPRQPQPALLLAARALSAAAAQLKHPLRKPAPNYPNLPSSVAVLGGAGVLGTMLVDHLLEAGVKTVKILDLRPYSGQYAKDPRVSSVVGSASDRKAVDEAIQGCNTVVAAITPHIPTAPWRHFVSANVHGTQTALNAAAAAGATAFVAVSSTAVNDLFAHHRNHDADTTPLPDLEAYRTPYELTKRLAEDLVLQANTAAGGGGLRTVALRPHSILVGPKDYTLEGIFKLGVSVSEGLPMDVTHGLNVCHAITLAAASLQDPGSRAAGRALTVSKGKVVTVGQLGRDLGARLGKRVPVLPGFLAAAIKGAGAVAGAIAHRRAPHNAPGLPLHTMLEMPGFEQTFDNSLARELLGFEPIYTYEEGLDLIVQEHHALSGRASTAAK